MKIILKHILRNIKEKKGRSLLIIISLMIASVVFILNLTIPNQIVETKMKQSRDAIGLSDILVASYTPFNIDDLKKSDEKTNIVGVNDLYLIHKDKTLVIYGTDINNASDINLVNDIDLKDDEIIISKIAADKYMRESYHNDKTLRKYPGVDIEDNTSDKALEILLGVKIQENLLTKFLKSHNSKIL